MSVTRMPIMSTSAPIVSSMGPSTVLTAAHVVNGSDTGRASHPHAEPDA
jgi:hypothetical protein